MVLLTLFILLRLEPNVSRIKICLFISFDVYTLYSHFLIKHTFTICTVCNVRYVRTILVPFPCLLYIFLILGRSTLSPAQSFNVILVTYVTESSISIVMSASLYLEDSQNLYLIVDSRYSVLALSLPVKLYCTEYNPMKFSFSFNFSDLKILQ